MCVMKCMCVVIYVEGWGGERGGLLLWLLSVVG